MDVLALVLAAALAIACVVFVARPFLREPAASNDRLNEPDPREQERIRLVEERDRALSALKELEFDHRTAKVSDVDYRELVGPLRRQAAEAVRALDAFAGAVYGAGEAGTKRARAVTPTDSLEVPPEPARVPEPWPPPDEGDLPGPPTPSPGEPTPGPEEPAPPRHPPMPHTGSRDVA